MSQSADLITAPRKDTQALYALQKSLAACRADPAQPCFCLSARADGPWVGLVATNDFLSFLKAVDVTLPLLSGCDVLLERLEQDRADHTVFHATVLHEGRQ